jgi:ribosomal protein S18 acetylase RimI-like enzyme
MTHPHISLSKLESLQIPKLLDFWKENAENDARPEDNDELVKQLLLHDPEAIIIAFIDDEIVGSVIAGWDGWRGSIYRLAVIKKLKRSGIGSLLMKKAEERLRRLGATRVNAMVLEENEDAKMFYSQLEYEAQEKWRRWVRHI